MRDDENVRFLFLNREKAWAGFDLVGLEVDDRGTLRLASVPSAPEGVPDSLGGPPPPEKVSEAVAFAAGVAVAPDGTVFLSDPEADRLLRRDTCDAVPRPVPWLAGSDDADTHLHRPRGVLYHVRRKVVLVADSGNHRVLVLDPATFALRDVWAEGLDEPWGHPDLRVGNRRDGHGRQGLVPDHGAGGGKVPGGSQLRGTDPVRRGRGVREARPVPTGAGTGRRQYVLKRV